MPLILVEDLQRDEKRVVQGQRDYQIVPVLDETTAASKKEFLALEGLRSLNRPSNALTLTVLTGTSAVVAFFENRRLPIFFIREKLLRVSFLSLLGYLVLLIR